MVSSNLGFMISLSFFFCHSFFVIFCQLGKHGFRWSSCYYYFALHWMRNSTAPFCWTPTWKALFICLFDYLRSLWCSCTDLWKFDSRNSLLSLHVFDRRYCFQNLWPQTLEQHADLFGNQYWFLLLSMILTLDIIMNTFACLMFCELVYKVSEHQAFITREVIETQQHYSDKTIKKGVIDYEKEWNSLCIPAVVNKVLSLSYL